jgi:hypothetical protein
LRYYLEGNNYRTIARKIHRGERAVSRLCRCPAIADKIQEVKELIVGQAEDWAESLNFAVRCEEDGAMALKLSQAFGAVPQQRKRWKSRRQAKKTSISSTRCGPLGS